VRFLPDSRASAAELKLSNHRGNPDKTFMNSPNTLSDERMDNVSIVRKPNLTWGVLMPESKNPKDGDGPPTEEKRSSIRVPVQVAVFCRNNQGEDELYWSAQVVDISRGGMQLVSRRKFEPTTLIRVCMSEESGISSEFLEAVVMRAQKSPDDEWTLGCALVRDLSEADLRAWIERNSTNLNTSHRRNGAPTNQNVRSSV
jgi:hypothetical protein